jgi:hypothetical protein
VEHGYLIVVGIPKLPDQAKEVILCERVETETEVEMASDEDLDDLEIDLE